MNLDEESHQFRPSASLIQKSKSSIGEYNQLHNKTTTSSGDADSYHQPVASPEENAQLLHQIVTVLSLPQVWIKLLPFYKVRMLQIVSYPHQKFKQRLLQLTIASLESLLQMIIPFQATKILIRLNRKANYLVKG